MVFDIRETRKEIAALKHDITRLYDSLNKEANARIEAEAEVERLKARVKALDPYGRGVVTKATDW